MDSMGRRYIGRASHILGVQEKGQELWISRDLMETGGGNETSETANYQW